MKLCQRIFAVIFIAAIIGFSILNISAKHNEIKSSLMEIEKPQNIEQIKNSIEHIEDAMVENIVLDNQWNETHAVLHNSLVKYEENGFEYVKDQNNVLYDGGFINTSSVEVTELIKRINVIRKKVEDDDTKVIVLLYPCKYYEKWSEGYAGVPYCEYNDMIDDMTAYFRYYSINYIDYREVFVNKNWTVRDIFYSTDHHWKTTAAFSGYQELVDYLNKEFDADLSPYYKNNYELITYENSFLGDQGRETGIAYAGMDDFTLITPKFDTNYTYQYMESSGEVVECKGDIYETLIDVSYLEEDEVYNKDLNKVYMDGIHIEEKVINHNNAHGLNVLFIRDSFTTPLSVFFSPYCNEMDLIWSTNSESEKLEAKVEEKNYDYIFIGLTIDSFANDGFEIYVDEVLNDE